MTQVNPATATDLLFTGPDAARANIETCIDLVNAEFSVNAWKMLNSISELQAMDQQFAEFKDLAARVGNTLTPPLSKVSARERTLRSALAAYLGRDADDAAPVEKLQAELAGYWDQFVEALRAAEQAAHEFITVGRKLAYNYLRTEESFVRRHPNVKKAMLYSSLLLALVETSLGTLSMLQPYLLVVPTTLEIGRTIGDHAVVEALAWWDSHSETHIQQAWPHVLAGEGRSPIRGLADLVTSPDNAILGTGAASDGLSFLQAMRPVMGVGLAAASVGAAQTGLGLAFTMYSIGMTIDELDQLDRTLAEDDEEPTLSPRQWKEVELLKTCTGRAFAETDKNKVRIWVRGGRFCIADAVTGKKVFMAGDGSWHVVGNGTAELGLAFAAGRARDGFSVDGVGGEYLADWDNATLAGERDRTGAYPFDVYLVDKQDKVGRRGQVRVDGDGKITAVTPHDPAPDAGFDAAVAGAKDRYFAISFPTQGALEPSVATAGTATQHLVNHAGFPLVWSSARYRSGAGFLGWYELIVATELHRGDCTVTVDPAGHATAVSMHSTDKGAQLDWTNGTLIAEDTYRESTAYGAGAGSEIESGLRLDQAERERPARELARAHAEQRHRQREIERDALADAQRHRAHEESDRQRREFVARGNEWLEQREVEQATETLSRVMPAGAASTLSPVVVDLKHATSRVKSLFM